MKTLDKVVRIGRSENVGNVFCHIEIKDGNLSVTGVEGPMRGGDCRGSCGQISKPVFSEFAPFWDQDKADAFFDAWKEWHLNDMQAGCEHQRKMGWDKIPIDPSKPLNAYGKHHPNQTINSWNMMTWVRATEVPGGLMCEPCPECGYKYGTAWLRKELPQAVIEFFSNLPDTDIQPAWI